MAIAVLETEAWVFEMVPVGSLKIDPSYHDARRLDEKRARRIADEWDPDAVGVITVSERRDGSRWIIDGHHRVVAARLLGVSRLPGKVYSDLSVAAEASIFIRLSDDVRLRPEHLWKARLSKGDPTALAITETLSRHGITIGLGGSSSPNAHTTRSLGLVEKIHNASMLHRVVGIMRVAWPEDIHALDAVPLSGVASFLAVYDGEYRHPGYRGDSRLVEKLAEYPASALIRTAKEIMAIGVSSSGAGRLGTGGANGGSSTRATLLGFGASRRAVLATYNRKTRTPLDDATSGDIRRLHLGQNPWASQ